MFLLHCVDAAGIDLNFRRSNDSDFKVNLDNFLLRATTAKYKNKTTLSDRLQKHRDNLLKALRAGEKIACPQDLVKYFDQQYILNAFISSQHRIIFHEARTSSKSAPQQGNSKS